MSIKLLPTFKLSKVDVDQLIKGYHAGSYTEIKLGPMKVRLIDPVSSTSIMAVNYSNNPRDAIFAITDRSNQDTIIATTNHKTLDYYEAKGGKLPSSGRCTWCRTFVNPGPKDGPGIDMKNPEYQMTLLPIHMTKVVINNNTIYVVYGIDLFCDESCCLAQCKLMYSLGIRQNEQQYSHSEQYIHQLYHLNNQDHKDQKDLVAAPDFRLLDINGGSLTYSEYKNSKYVYSKSMNVLMIPVKEQYIRSNLK